MEREREERQRRNEPRTGHLSYNPCLFMCVLLGLSTVTRPPVCTSCNTNQTDMMTGWSEISPVGWTWTDETQHQYSSSPCVCYLCLFSCRHVETPPRLSDCSSGPSLSLALSLSLSLSVSMQQYSLAVLDPPSLRCAISVHTVGSYRLPILCLLRCICACVWLCAACGMIPALTSAILLSPSHCERRENGRFMLRFGFR